MSTLREVVDRLVDRWDYCKSTGHTYILTDDDIEALRASAPRQGEPWGWAIMGHGDFGEIAMSPIRNVLPNARQHAEGIAKEVNGYALPLYAGAPGPEASGVRAMLERVIEDIHNEGMRGWADTLRDEPAQLKRGGER